MPLQSADAQQGDAVSKQLTLLRAKAEQGDAEAQNSFGLAFSTGKFGLATNSLEAVIWFRKSAEQNDAGAQLNLGISYDTGHGVAQDSVEAVQWSAGPLNKISPSLNSIWACAMTRAKA